MGCWAVLGLAIAATVGDWLDSLDAVCQFSTKFEELDAYTMQIRN
jgi:hypothetical protein